MFYRDVAGFVLGFVAVHIEICLSDTERRDAFDVFFDRSVVPPARAAAALASVLAGTSASKSSGDKRQADADDAVTVSHCVRLLEKTTDSEGLQAIVADLLSQEVRRRFEVHRSTDMSIEVADAPVAGVVGFAVVSRSPATGVQHPDTHLASRVAARYASVQYAWIDLARVLMPVPTFALFRSGAQPPRARVSVCFSPAALLSGAVRCDVRCVLGPERRELSSWRLSNAIGCVSNAERETHPCRPS